MRPAYYRRRVSIAEPIEGESYRVEEAKRGPSRFGGDGNAVAANMLWTIMAVLDTAGFAHFL